MFRLIEDEQPRIANLEDNRESCLEFWEHLIRIALHSIPVNFSIPVMR